MKINDRQDRIKWTIRLIIIVIAICVLTLSGCGADQKTSEKQQSNATQSENEAADEIFASGPYWRMEVSDVKSFPYSIPNGSGGTIDMTATLNFIAWKEGGDEMFGQYEGRALVTFDMDFSKIGTGGVSFMGGAMEDSISENISFELLPAHQKAVTAADEDIDLAPLVEFVGQAKIVTDEYTISQQNWKALADGETKLDVNGGFGDGKRYSQGFTLKAGEDTILVSVNDFAAAYNLDAFRGTIAKVELETDPRSWFRDKVMTRMEERMASAEQSAVQQMPDASLGGYEGQSGYTVDAEGREGMDTNGDGRFEIYIGEDGEVWADFDGDGKYEIAGSDGSSDMN